jgi:hypothetical protein
MKKKEIRNEKKVKKGDYDFDTFCYLEGQLLEKGTQIFLDTKNKVRLYNPEKLNEDELWATKSGKALKQLGVENIDDYLYVQRLLDSDNPAHTFVTLTPDSKDYEHFTYGLSEPELPFLTTLKVSIYPFVNNMDIVKSLRAIAQSIEQNCQKLNKYKARASKIDAERDKPSKRQVKVAKIIERSLETKVPTPKKYEFYGGRVSD